jgi:hypothetical protein
MIQLGVFSNIKSILEMRRLTRREYMRIST